VRVLHLMSCRGWSSDAYWATRLVCELARRGHDARLVCRRGSEARVIARARAAGIERIATLALPSGVKPVDLADLRRLAAWLADVDVVHVHRGKEHWLAALANRVSPTPRPIVRTRHIAQAVRPHRANRWLYRHGTSLVVTVSEAIRQQYLASELLPPARVMALPGGVDIDAYRPGPADPELRRRLGGMPERPLIGMIAGLRVMKGHRTVIQAAARLAAAGLRPRFVFVGAGSQEATIRTLLVDNGLEGQVSLTGFVEDLPAVMRVLDIALYVPLESDGMSRVVWEYLAAGRPLIASRVGVVAETLTDGVHALLVHGGDSADLAGALRRLLQEPDLAARLGDNGRRLLLERYSGGWIAAALEEQYARLAG
jgi:glycosyltransferase involved in cell wall biosynthesis